MTDLSKLSPAVREAVERISDSETVTATPDPNCNALVKMIDVDDWHTIRAELLRLSAVEAELAGIKERIAKAPFANEVEWEAVKDGFWITTRTRVDHLPPEGSRFRLVREQEAG